uniref:Caspase-17 n=1 Tax=Oncorhynchus mykiss TaxID=8022 RepID=A0A8E8HX82_ONCMY|nr:caspase-17 [Oncorhynchus mykiss]
MPLWRRTNAGDEECNRAVLVSESNFDHGVPLGRRPGAEKDTKRLHGALTRLGYRVDIHMDLNAQEIYTLFKTVFFIQACRGGELDDGVTVETDSAGSDIIEDTLSQYLSIPMDTAVMYATAPGYGAFMNPLGAVFLQTFCILLEEEGGGALELTRLLTCISHRVAFCFEANGCLLGGGKEMPCFVSRLTRELFPFAEPGRRAWPMDFLPQHSSTPSTTDLTNI